MTEFARIKHPVAPDRYQALLDSIQDDIEKRERREAVVRCVVAVVLWLALIGVIVEAGVLLW